MNFFEFASDSPWLCFFLMLVVTSAIFKIWNRFMRHLNISSKRWPPAHLDADGDHPTTKEDEE